MNWLSKIVISQITSPEDILVRMCRGDISVQDATSALSMVPNNAVCETASALLFTWPGASRELNEIIRLFGCNETSYVGEEENNNIDTAVSDFE